MATEIIKKLKRKIRIMWAVIVVMAILLFITNCDINVAQSICTTRISATKITNPDDKIYYIIQEKTKCKNRIWTRRKEKGNTE